MSERTPEHHLPQPEHTQFGFQRDFEIANLLWGKEYRKKSRCHLALRTVQYLGAIHQKAEDPLGSSPFIRKALLEDIRAEMLARFNSTSSTDLREKSEALSLDDLRTLEAMTLDAEEIRALHNDALIDSVQDFHQTYKQLYKNEGHVYLKKALRVLIMHTKPGVSGARPNEAEIAQLCEHLNTYLSQENTKKQFPFHRINEIKFVIQALQALGGKKERKVPLYVEAPPVPVIELRKPRRKVRDAVKKVLTRSVLAGALATGFTSAGMNALRWAQGPQPRTNIFENSYSRDAALPESYKLTASERAYAKRRIIGSLKKYGDFRAKAKNEGVSVQERAEEWADYILNAFEKSGIPATEENLKLGLILVFRESRLTADPGIGTNNITRAYERSRDKLEAKIETLLPDALKPLLQAGVTYLDQGDETALRKKLPDVLVDVMTELVKGGYGERLKAAKTEKEVDDILGELRRPALAVLGTLDALFPNRYTLSVYNTLEDKLQVGSLGALQVNRVAAADYFEARTGYRPSDEEAKDRMFNVEDNLQVGFSIFHQAFQEYKGDPNQIRYAFADYNAGLYSSRNAAFQMMLEGLTRIDLSLDGDLNLWDGQMINIQKSKTQVAVDEFLRRYAKDRNPLHRKNDDICYLLDRWIQRPEDLALGDNGCIYVDRRATAKSDLLNEKSPDFERSPLYRAVAKVYRSGKGREVPVAVMPEAEAEGARDKYGRDFGVEWYVEDSMRYVRNFKW